MTTTPRVGITELLANKLTGSVALLCLRVSAQSPAELAENIRAITPGKLAYVRGGSKGNQLLFDPVDIDAVPREWRERHAAGLLGIGEVAERLRLSTGQVRSAAADGRIPSVVTDGNTRRFRPGDIEA